MRNKTKCPSVRDLLYSAAYRNTIVSNKEENYTDTKEDWDVLVAQLVKESACNALLDQTVKSLPTMREI